MSDYMQLQQLTPSARGSLGAPPSAPGDPTEAPGMSDSSMDGPSGLNGPQNADGDMDSSTKELMGSFRDVLSNQLDDLEAQQTEATDKAKQFAAGEIDDVHDVTMSMQKASMSMEIATLVRNRLLQGFEDLQNLR